MMKKLSKIIIIVLVIAVIVFLIAQDLVWNGKLTAQTDFLKFTPYFSVLKPQDLVVRQAEGNYLKSQPVYFDLYLPRDFEQAKIEVEYKDEYGYQILIGPNMKTGWDTKALADLPSEGNGYKIKSVDFGLTDKNINNGKLRFQILIPDLNDQEKGIYLKGVKVILTRPAIWQENPIDNLIKYFTYVKNQF